MKEIFKYAVVGALVMGALYYFKPSFDLHDERDLYTPSRMPLSPKSPRGNHWRPSIRDFVELTDKELFKLEVPPELPSGEYNASDYDNIIVIPDVHGDATNFLISLWIAVVEVEKIPINFDNFRALVLEAAGTGIYPEYPLIPSSRNIAVSLGDLVDRGKDSVLCMRILWVIKSTIGWPVVSLYGNHEIMSHSGYADEYISLYEINELGSIAERNKLFAKNAPLWKRLSSEALLMARFSTHSEANGVLGNILFNHAGPEPVFIDKAPDHIIDSIESLNKHAKLAVTAEDGSGDYWLSLLMNNANSPIWSRVLTNNDPDEQETLCGKILPTILERFKVDRLILGHTPQEDHRMKVLCDGQIVLADCAMSRDLFGDSGQPGVLVIDNMSQSMYAVYYNTRKGQIHSEPLFTPSTRPTDMMDRAPSASRDNIVAEASTP